MGSSTTVLHTSVLHVADDFTPSRAGAPTIFGLGNPLMYATGIAAIAVILVSIHGLGDHTTVMCALPVTTNDHLCFYLFGQADVLVPGSN